MNLTPIFRPGASQDVAVPASGSAPVSADIGGDAGTMVVRLHATTPCYVTFSGDPNSRMLMAAGWPETLILTGTTSLTAVSNSGTTGTLNVTRMSR